MDDDGNTWANITIRDTAETEHFHVTYTAEGRGALKWNNRSDLVVNGYRYTAVDCQDPDCPYKPSVGELRA